VSNISLSTFTKAIDNGNIETKNRTHQQLDEDEPKFVWDEISTFLDTRYVSAPEAAWRINNFALSNRSHVISQLAVHL
jgi:hypothetical protein